MQSGQGVANHHHLVKGSRIWLSGRKPLKKRRPEALQSVPREEWPMNSVQAVMLSRDGLQLAAPEDSAVELLERMRSSNVDQMAVITGGNIVGMVTRDSISRAVQTRNDVGHLTGSRS